MAYLAECLNSWLDNHGGNDYSITHMGKEKLERNGNLPVVLQVSQIAQVFTRETNLTDDGGYKNEEESIDDNDQDMNGKGSNETED